MASAASSASSRGVLPPLVFGDTGATVGADPAAFIERIATVVTSLRDCAPIGNARAFRQKSSTVVIDGLKLVASACTPVHVDVGDTDDHTILIPYAGQSHAQTADGATHDWRPGETGLFLPGAARKVRAAPLSLLMIDVEPARLQAVARAMLGVEPDTDVDFMLDRTRAIDLRQGGVAFDTVFRQLCGLVDAYGGEPHALAALGLDDQFYRHAVMLLRPGLRAEERLQKAVSGHSLDSVCDYIASRLHAPVSLTDLERVSGLSRRSLQYAFWQRHKCSPMQWVRAKRLDRARSLLMAGDSQETVTSAALRFGFSNLGAFSAYYRERFGERPSETLRRKSGRGG